MSDLFSEYNTEHNLEISINEKKRAFSISLPFPHLLLCIIGQLAEKWLQLLFTRNANLSVRRVIVWKLKEKLPGRLIESLSDIIRTQCFTPSYQSYHKNLLSPCAQVR